MTGEIVAFVGRHAVWAGPALFGVSFGESLAFVSLLFPGTAIMIAAGAFVPDGTLDLWPLLVGSIAGATLGDAVSYWLGRRYGHWIGRWWPFSHHPELLERGLAFFEQHGGKSVFIGRFFGPLRAIIPLVAGIAKMPSPRFWVANILSALIWASALLLQGALAVIAIDTLQVVREWRWFLLVVIAALAASAVWAAKKYGFFGRLLKF